MKTNDKRPDKLSGIIFDFNGVLLWDDALQRRSWRQFSARYRQAPLSDAEIDLHVRGRTNPYTLAYLLGHPLNPQEVERLSEEKERIYRQMCLDLGPDFQLSPGAVDTLAGLAVQGIPRTIATSSGEANVDFFVAHLQLGKWFEVEQIVCDGGRFPGKPAPDIFLHAARKLGLDPAQCVVVEDSSSGIEAARRAGIGHIIALGPKDQHNALGRTPGVSQVIEHLGQLRVQELFNGRLES
jgi:beta-phosphoglucomutase